MHSEKLTVSPIYVFAQWEISFSALGYVAFWKHGVDRQNLRPSIHMRSSYASMVAKTAGAHFTGHIIMITQNFESNIFYLLLNWYLTSRGMPLQKSKTQNNNYNFNGPLENAKSNKDPHRTFKRSVMLYVQESSWRERRGRPQGHAKTSEQVSWLLFETAYNI